MMSTDSQHRLITFAIEIAKLANNAMERKRLSQADVANHLITAGILFLAGTMSEAELEAHLKNVAAGVKAGTELHAAMGGNAGGH